MKRKNFTLPIITAAIAASALIVACEKDFVAPEVAPDASWTEEFDTLQNAMDRGRVVINNSRPLGASSWMQGQFGADKKGFTGYPAASASYSGTDFAVATYNATGTEGTISAWLISPPTLMKNGDQIKFFTRTLVNPANFPDRMQVRLNPNSSSTNVGSLEQLDLDAAEQVGDFTTLLLDINPTQNATAFPGTWTQYTITLSGLPAPVVRRFAFRYYVHEGGTAAVNGEGVAVDKVEFISK